MRVVGWTATLLCFPSIIRRRRRLCPFDRHKRTTTTTTNLFVHKPNKPRVKNGSWEEEAEDALLSTTTATPTATLTNDNDTTVLVEATNATTTTTTTIAPSTAVLLLNVVAILWGSQHSITKRILTTTDSDNITIDPSVFVLLRFGIATLVTAPAIWKLVLSSDTSTTLVDTTSNHKNNATTTTTVTTSFDNNTWRWGTELGVYLFGGFFLQSVGLYYTTAQKSGFLLYLNVKFVPFLAWLWYNRPPTPATLLSAGTAVLGTALLLFSSSSNNNNVSSHTLLNVGDGWTVLAAMVSALYILRLETASGVVGDAAALNSASLLIVTLLSAIWVVVVETWRSGGGGGSFFGSVQESANVGVVPQMVFLAQHYWLELIYLGGVTTALSNYIQTLSQKAIRAERAAIIYALDPVYGALFAYWILGETLEGWRAWLGAGLITVAAATNALWDASPRESDTAIADSRDHDDVKED